MIQKSVAIEELLDQYLHLDIAGKKVHCPYWMNIIHPGPGHQKIWGPYGGKGKPHEIVKAVLEIARMDGIPLEGMSSWQIKRFMEKNRVGVDCSGLAYWLLDVLDREKGGNGLQDNIPRVKGRFLTRASVAMLTDDGVSVPIKRITEVKIGDMIKSQGGKHLAVIIRMKKVREQKKELVYAHSSNLTEVKGVHTDKILIRNCDGGLEKQAWLEKTAKGENYGQKYFHPEMGDGIRRLKIWQNQQFGNVAI